MAGRDSWPRLLIEQRGILSYWSLTLLCKGSVCFRASLEYGSGSVELEMLWDAHCG